MYVGEAFGHSKKHQPSPDPAIPLRYHPTSLFPSTPQIVKKPVHTCFYHLTTHNHIGLYNPLTLCILTTKLKLLFLEDVIT